LIEKNANYLRVNKNCSATELHAIMKDHYEMMDRLAETPLGKHTFISPRQSSLKLKKKKQATMIDSSWWFQRHFSIFESRLRNTNELMAKVVQLNGNCRQKKMEHGIDEVSLEVDEVQGSFIRRVQ
jgi:hypothetical protein